jgi:hypothetical protein
MEVNDALKPAMADWSNLPKDIYVIEAFSHGDIAFDVKCCSVPMMTVPEVRYTRADPVAQRHPGVMRALSEKPIQTSDNEFTAADFQHVAQLLRSTDEKVVRASMSNWYNAILGALDFAAKFEPKLTAAKADEIYASQLMRKFRDTLSNIVDGCEDEGDRVYFGSTNAADELREISEEIEELAWDKILASSQKKPDLWATIRELNAKNRAQAASILHYQNAKPTIQRMPQTPERDEALQCFDRAEKGE